jgi:hypothetical protein
LGAAITVVNDTGLATERFVAGPRYEPTEYLTYDGHAYLIPDTEGACEWPEITTRLAETVPWRIETARLFGREMPVRRMTAWFGDADYTYSGIHHRAAPFLAIVHCCANGRRISPAHHTTQFNCTNG